MLMCVKAWRSRSVFPGHRVPERSNECVSFSTWQVSSDRLSSEILRSSIHSTVSTWGGFGRTAEICIFPRRLSQDVHFSLSGFSETTSTAKRAILEIAPSETTKRTVYFPVLKEWFPGFSLSEVEPSQKSQYQVFAPMLFSPVKLRLHCFARHKKQWIPFSVIFLFLRVLSADQFLRAILFQSQECFYCIVHEVFF